MNWLQQQINDHFNGVLESRESEWKMQEGLKRQQQQKEQERRWREAEQLRDEKQLGELW